MYQECEINFYPRATRCGGDIVTLLWFRPSVRGHCEHDRDYTIACFFVKLGRHVSHDERMNPIDFEGQRSKVKVTMGIYGNKLLNTIAIKPLIASWSNLADMLAMLRGWTLLILKVTGQRSKVTMDIYGDKLLNTIETKPVFISSSNLAEMLNMVRLWTLLILEVRCPRSRSHGARMEISCKPNTDLTVVCFLIKLGRHVNHGQPYWFWRPQFKGEGHDGYNWQMWDARGCYALRCYISFCNLAFIQYQWQFRECANEKWTWQKGLKVASLPLLTKYVSDWIVQGQLLQVLHWEVLEVYPEVNRISSKNTLKYTTHEQTHINRS